MKTPHVHADVIKAWADGAIIEARACLSLADNRWGGWCVVENPEWVKHQEYRVKPEVKPDRIEEMSVYRNMHRRYDYVRPYDEPVIAGFLATVRITFCGNTGVVKSMEVI